MNIEGGSNEFVTYLRGSISNSYKIRPEQNIAMWRRYIHIRYIHIWLNTIASASIVPKCRRQCFEFSQIKETAMILSTLCHVPWNNDKCRHRRTQSGTERLFQHSGLFMLTYCTRSSISRAKPSLKRPEKLKLSSKNE